MTNSEHHAAIYGDAIDCGLGTDHICLYVDTRTDKTVCVELPIWDDKMADAFYETIEEAFYGQGAYMRRCNYCGSPYPYFPRGLQFGNCGRSECVEKAILATEACIREQAQEQEAQHAGWMTEKAKRDAERERKRAEKQAQIEATREINGYVYLMRSENGLYKIGRARNTNQRLSGLNREIPIKVEVIHTIPCRDYVKAERIMHERYKAERVKYEWFHLSPSQVDEIMAIRPFGIDDDLDTR